VTAVLRTAGAPLRPLEMRPVQRLLSVLANPDIAYILLTLGFLGLYFELAHPGAVLPGVVGGVAIVLAFFSLSFLPVDYAGVALIVLGLLFFVLEIKITSYGMLTVAGVISLLLGSSMLFKTTEPALRVSRDVRCRWRSSPPRWPVCW
jgi:membrane-bound serine protease (ClpP class)